ncbi:neutral alpha-glucosidase AB [Eurytemora carolleeae]|uniref:neutral alpha-glucosidase AB n=1 Tax=Eurytemora carolleeae TaxID=1294199 RepID=UPI000C78EA21|nr:neutral alpha-glucosidase AB [Eurytemora carolleeae]|eukprot:XP_023336041.1 neutral alpha-glucosidase AB-like [Eurytemora affinis]
MLRRLIVLVWLVTLVRSVDRSRFKTCSQSGFCQRCRAKQENVFTLSPDSLHISSSTVEALLIDTKTTVKYKLEISGLADNTFRVKVTEAFPLKPRFEVPLVLQQIELTAITKLSQDADSLSFGLSADTNSKVVLNYQPFRLDFFSGGELVMSANSRGLMRFEHTREKVEGDDQNETEPGMWQETFGGHTDSKPNGPQAVALDFAFIGMEHVYGIPQHADTFSLKDTTGSDPYRLYNLDVFEYELWNTMALYAAIPFMMGHNKQKTTGLFVLNAAEGWVDIKKNNEGILGSLSNMVSGSTPQKQVETHWMFESGVLDFFVLLGPGPKEVSRQYGVLTGTTPLPQEFSIGYHQCRWNYNDQGDVEMVNSKFDEFDIPMDVMWLDIEHTDGKKYFTWDGRKFPDSIEMTENLVSHGRKLVTIVDPHIKKDSGYWVHNDLTSKGLYVKNSDGNDYEGWCWPGSSYYPDFLNKDARDYFAEQYKLENYKGSTLDVYTWNDMNEPSVFNGPEVTMPKDKKHGEYEHRDLHNQYGMLYSIATHQGHLVRSDNKLRPFVLTRAAFAGSQKYAAIWTGDNTAEWGHLEASVPMCLSFSVAGMAFVGADVGGFFGNPDGELIVRWYQAAAFQPFLRGHAHLDSKRREPWLFSAGEMALIREALRTRYSFLPFWYTQFYEAEVTGVPVMRPLWYEFPQDEGTFGREGIHMVGNSLLVAPVLHKSATQVNVYFPGNQIWYDIVSFQKYEVSGEISIQAGYEKVPVYQRGGTIIPRKQRIRRSSVLMHEDPITLHIALDKEQKAEGTLYIDDGQSFEYKEGKFIYVTFKYEKGTLEAKLNQPAGIETKVWLEKVVILGSGPANNPAKVTDKTGEKYVDTLYNSSTGALIIRKPGVNLGSGFTISLN